MKRTTVRDKSAILLRIRHNEGLSRDKKLKINHRKLMYKILPNMETLIQDSFYDLFMYEIFNSYYKLLRHKLH